MPTAATQTEQTLTLRSATSHENLLFDYPDADLILRSLDSYEFRVLRMYIVHSSPILGKKVLFSPNPQAQPVSTPTIPTKSDVEDDAINAPCVVELPIQGPILFSLLTYIFPVPPVLPSTVEQVMELLSVAQLYKMDVVLTHIRNHIAQQKPPFIREETAFLIYSLSQKQALRTEALQAARCTLNFSGLNIRDLAEEQKLDMMPNSFLYELWKYQERVRSNLASDLNEFKRSKVLTILGELSISSESLTDSSIPSWLESYISTIGTGRVPVSLDPTDFHMDLEYHCRTGWGSIRGCTSCSDISRESIRELWGALTDVVRGSISKVRVTYRCRR